MKKVRVGHTAFPSMSNYRISFRLEDKKTPVEPYYVFETQNGLRNFIHINGRKEFEVLRKQLHAKTFEEFRNSYNFYCGYSDYAVYIDRLLEQRLTTTGIQLIIKTNDGELHPVHFYAEAGHYKPTNTKSKMFNRVQFTWENKTFTL